MRFKHLLWVGLLAAATAAVARCEDWPQFRGPGGCATSPETVLPDQWGADKNIAWKVKIPGHGWSCPVVWGDKVFVTTAVADKQGKPALKPDGGYAMIGNRPDEVYKWQVYCLSATSGTVLWKQTAAEKKPAIATNPANGYATETPVTDGERVYAYFGGIGSVFAYDIAGKPAWQADLGAHQVQFGHGTASSPVLAEGRLIVQCDNAEKSFLVALNTQTGKELWRTPRTEQTAWSSPLVWKNTVRTEVVCVGSPRVRSYDPASGKQLWELGNIVGQMKASAVADKDHVYVGGGGFSTGGSRPLFAVKAGASGDITLKRGEKSSAAVAWHLPTAGPETSSPLLYEGHLYVLEDKTGLVHCFDARSGNRLYRERLAGAQGFAASPWAYGGKVFCLDSGGTTYVLKAGPQFELVGENQLGEMAWSSPAAANGALFLRTVDHLYCIRRGERKVP